METNKKIILFDGVCNLCNGFVNFVIEKDQNDTFRFASLQSEIGKKLLSERTIDTTTIDSVLFIDPNVAYYIKSDAALQIGLHIKGYRTISRVLKLIPTKLRNTIYDFIARNRYKWYGKKETCRVATPELHAKFL